ncbi:MAG TPA: hypothetical protein VMR49_02590 [Candidatus Paceibacterota bacterium]|nr:hypothetical protein [Candidatus Paceibacterota bacterium]
MVKRKKDNISFNKGEMHFGLEVLLFLLAIFIIWVFMGGAKNDSAKKPFIKSLNDASAPGQVYGPGN